MRSPRITFTVAILAAVALYGVAFVNSGRAEAPPPIHFDNAPVAKTSPLEYDAATNTVRLAMLGNVAPVVPMVADVAFGPAPAPGDPVGQFSGLIGAIQAHNWTMVISLALMLLAWLVVVKSPIIEEHWASFFHTNGGKLLLSSVAPLFLVIAHTIASSGFSWPPLVIGIGEFLFGRIMISNPSLISAKASVADVAAVNGAGGPLAARRALRILNNQSGIIQLAMLPMIFAVGLGLVLGSANCTSGKAGQSVVNVGVECGAALVSDALKIISAGGGGWEAELGNLPGTVSDIYCAVKTVLSTLRAKHAAMSKADLEAANRAQTWLDKHPMPDGGAK